MPGPFVHLGPIRPDRLGAILLQMLLLCGICAAKSLTWTADSAGRNQAELWLDPYYTAVNGTHTFSSEPIVRLNSDGERDADWWLLEHIVLPRDVLLEGSVNPLPVAGWATRKWARGAYGDASLDENNLVQALTEGFPEPWAVSLFLGNVVDFVSAADTTKVNGVGYSGILASWGAWHLVDNRLIRDDWVETEIKIKGDDIRPSRKLGWSFRGGWRENFNDEIRDAVFASIVRSRTDFQYAGWNPLRNSSLEMRMDLDRRSLPRLVVQRISLVVGKKFPFARGKAAFCVSAGLVDDLRPAYDGSLRPLAPRGPKLLLQPNIDW